MIKPNPPDSTNSTNPLDALTEAERAYIDALPSVERARALLAHNRAAIRRAARRAAMDALPKAVEPVPGLDLAMLAGAFSAELNGFALSDDVVQTAAVDSDFARALASLQARARSLAHAALQQDREKAAGTTSVTAAATYMTPDEFRRRVQLRRRRDALRKRRRDLSARGTAHDPATRGDLSADATLRPDKKREGQR